MKVCNVVEIYDSGELVSIVTISGTVVHLPDGKEKHSISLVVDGKSNSVDALIEFNEG